MVSNRWEKAQKKERSAVAEISSRPWKLSDSERSENLARVCKYTSLPVEQLKNMRILEIGGSLVGRAFYNIDCPLKLFIDPILWFTHLIGENDRSCHFVLGVGEYLPLRDMTIDLCWCANTIDHTSSPIAVLREIKRVFGDNAILVISCHVSPAWTRALLPLFNILDRPHPHHFTLGGVKSLLRKEFEIKEEIEAGVIRRVPVVRYPKDLIAKIIGVRYFYFRCISRSAHQDSVA